jgi:hypothetical protein
VRRLLVTASVVPSSWILVTLMKEALRSSETTVLIRATRRNIPEDAILYNKDVRNPHLSQDYNHEGNKGGMDRLYSMHGDDEIHHDKKLYNGEHGVITLTLILNKLSVRMWTGYLGFRWSSVMGFLQHGNECHAPLNVKIP